VSGAWTLTYSGPALSPGSHSFTATATDLAGNTGPPSAASTIDTTVATPVITAITDDTGSSTTDGVTSDNTLVIRGTAAAEHTIREKPLGVATVGTTTADGAGQWSFDHTATALADGSYVFAASASNGAGASPSSPGFTVRVDTLAPTVVSVNRQNPTAASSSADTITFRVTFSEQVSGVDASDFTLTFSGGLVGAISGVTQVGGSVFDVTAGPLAGEGGVRLDVNAGGAGVADIAGNSLNIGFTTGQVYTRSLTGNGIWTQAASGGLWGANPNWFNGIVGGGVGNTADFSTLEVADGLDLVVRLDSPRAVGNLVFGDTDVASAGNWIIDNNGDAANTLTLTVAAGSPTVTVNPLGVGASTVFRILLAGNQGMTKLGDGPLALTVPSSLTGALTVN